VPDGAENPRRRRRSWRNTHSIASRIGAEAMSGISLASFCLGSRVIEPGSWVLMQRDVGDKNSIKKDRHLAPPTVPELDTSGMLVSDPACS